MADSLLIVFVTVPDEETSKKIASALLEKNLAACINVLPGVTSTYRWEGKIQSSSESLMKIKSKSSLFSELKEEISQLHPYSVPEIVGISTSHVNEPYLKWAMAETKEAL